MPFSPAIREEALVKSARRCCVCREFGGRNLQVHHIDQEAHGGANTLDNAIVLCFKCHAEAGHYNPEHALGSKYAPSELRKLRDKLWADVQQGYVPEWDEQRATSMGTWNIRDEAQRVRNFLELLEPLLLEIKDFFWYQRTSLPESLSSKIKSVCGGPDIWGCVNDRSTKSCDPRLLYEQEELIRIMRRMVQSIGYVSWQDPRASQSVVSEELVFLMKEFSQKWADLKRKVRDG